MLADVVQTIKGNQEFIPSIAWLEVFDRRLIGSRKRFMRLCPRPFHSASVSQIGK